MSRGVNHPQATTLLHKSLENTTDLSQLPSISDDIILSCLRERFLADNIYTAIGSSVLVSLNPYKFVGSNADSTLTSYAVEYRDTAEEKTYRPPHMFQLANNAYYHMRRTGQDQNILITFATLLLSIYFSFLPTLL
jgi:chitin synthase